MPYRIEFAHTAAKDFRKQRDKNLKEKLLCAIEELAGNPLAGKPLQGELKGCYSYRVGDYRVIYSFSSRKNILSVIKIDHRRQVYR